jgi:hypothetical protein
MRSKGTEGISIAQIAYRCSTFFADGIFKENGVKALSTLKELHVTLPKVS